MQTVADVVAEARESDAPLFETPGGPTDHSYDAFLTTTWKTGNLLRHYGVRPGDSVAVVVGPNQPAEDDEPGRLGTAPTPLLAVLGGLLAGASIDLDPVTTVEAKALVAPSAWIDRYTPGPGTKPIGYGEEHDEPTVAQLEREVWSENPVAPPVDLDPTTRAIGGTSPLVHGDLLAEARRIVADYDLDGDARVGLAAPITPGALVAGVLAPILAGGTIVLLEDGGRSSGLDVIIGPEPDASTVEHVDPRSVFSGQSH